MSRVVGAPVSLLTRRCVAYCSGVLNKADLPSREEQYAGTRLDREVLRELWKSVGPFTWDAFASEATAFIPPGWEGYPIPECYLDYFSLSEDRYSKGTDCFTQNVAERDGVEEFMYANPPHVCARAAVLFFAESRARALFVLPLPEIPAPYWWDELVVRYATWQRVLPVTCNEYRVNGGWAASSRPMAQIACVLDFRDRAARSIDRVVPSFGGVDV